MIKRLLDKLVFGAALLLSLQLPLLAEHYHQYLAGFYQATQLQVDGYSATAKAHQFADLDAMIAQHLQNPEPSVRDDARQKQATVDLLQELQAGIYTFEQGYLPEKLWFMLQPKRLPQLQAVVKNFTPGIPLTGEALLFAVLCALLLNLLLMWPFYAFGRQKTIKQHEVRS
ncbi:DUF2937 family protein [Rheinheimera sp.]|uniref:DUF2937 family protein n=1 Tax=Rheinheimera sp. TaxID=1869214 RepID=UPI003AF90DBD